MVRDPFSFSLPLRFARPLAVPLIPFLWPSSSVSSTSSFLVRLPRPELLEDGRGGLCVLSFGLGAVSVVGEPVGGHHDSSAAPISRLLCNAVSR